MLEIWAERDALEKVDYLEYSNTLFKLNQIPWDKLGAELPIADKNLADPELAEKSSKLSLAKDTFASVEIDYGVDSPKYKTAKQDFERAQQAYDLKIKSIIDGLKDRVAEDSSLLQIIEQNEGQIKAMKRDKDEALLSYSRLKNELENLKSSMRESERKLNEEIAMARQSDAGIVIVRDPARVATHPVSPFSRTVLMWLLGGAALAFLAGGVAAWLATRIPPVSPRQGAS